jgi:hypothetical protein
MFKEKQTEKFFFGKIKQKTRREGKKSSSAPSHCVTLNPFLSCSPEPKDCQHSRRALVLNYNEPKSSRRRNEIPCSSDNDERRASVRIRLMFRIVATCVRVTAINYKQHSSLRQTHQRFFALKIPCCCSFSRVRKRRTKNVLKKVLRKTLLHGRNHN